jgi:predicted metal-dependent peptidase
MSQQFKEIKFYIMCCDTELTEPFILTTKTKNLLKKIKLKGGGGTSFKPVFNWIKKESLNLDCLIYFTDLYGDFPEEKPMYNTYWVTQTDNIEVPFGRIIKLKI